MKKFLSAVSAILLIAGCSDKGTENEKTTLEKMNLNGKVKEIKVKRYTYSVEMKWGKYEYDESVWHYMDHIKFNENGYWTEWTFYLNIFGEIDILSKTIYEYDSENRLVKEDYYIEDGHLSSTILYTYNGNNISEETHTDFDNPEKSHRTIYTYDDSNKLVEINYNDSKTKYFYSQEEYDSFSIPEENLFEATLLDENGKTIASKRIYYDYENLANPKRFYIEDQYEYINRNLSRYSRLENNIPGSSHFTYDEHNNIIKATGIHGFEFEPYLVFLDPIALTFIDGNNSISINCTYEYDSNNNWIKACYSTSENEHGVVTREITYY